MRVLWLHPPGFAGARHELEKLMFKRGIKPANVIWYSMHSKVQELMKYSSATRFTWNRAKEEEFAAALNKLVTDLKIDMIVINDEATLGHISKEHVSLDRCRGGVYHWGKLPCLVIDSVLKCKFVKEHTWIMLNDLGKLRRWMEGKQYHEPKFKLTVVDSIPELLTFGRRAMASPAISCDIETCSAGISCIGYTFINERRELESFVIPFVNPLRDGQAHWRTEAAESRAWKIVKAINACNTPKVMQNGSYDCSFFVLYRVPLVNYVWDTMHMFHSIWTEAPKSIDFICSILLDFYKYWKHENKDDSNDAKKYSRVPGTKEKLDAYWTYNALDCHYTLLAFIRLTDYLRNSQLAWACKNYAMEIALQLGPAFQMSMTGLPVNHHRQAVKFRKNMKKHDERLADLKIMTDNPNFNPNSGDDYAEFLYKTLGAQPFIIRKGKKKFGAPENEQKRASVDEKALKFVRLQHPIYAYFIDAVWDCKKAGNNASKYGEMPTINGRFLYQYSAGGTETGRFNGKKHYFNVGTNPQNIPVRMRDFVVADPGYFIFEADYSQSDGYFVAFESQDEKMIANLLDPRDTHCLHAEFFFKKSFDEIYKGYKEKEEWVVHPLRGVRNPTKRVVHGANYRMQGPTLYATMGHEAVIATMLALGCEDAPTWERRKLEIACDALIETYYKLYRRLPIWFKETVGEAVSRGNLATCFGGRTRLFFGNIAEDKAIQREVSAYLGQGGTGGNINRAMLNVYYKSDAYKRGAFFVLQTHDSFALQIPDREISLCKDVRDIMMEECEIKGRRFRVPVEAKAGRTWSDYAMAEWHVDLTISDIDAKELEFVKKEYGNVKVA